MVVLWLRCETKDAAECSKCRKQRAASHKVKAQSLEAFTRRLYENTHCEWGEFDCSVNWYTKAPRPDQLDCNPVESLHAGHYVTCSTQWLSLQIQLVPLDVMRAHVALLAVDTFLTCKPSTDEYTRDLMDGKVYQDRQSLRALVSALYHAN